MRMSDDEVELVLEGLRRNLPGTRSCEKREKEEREASKAGYSSYHTTRNHRVTFVLEFVYVSPVSQLVIH